MQRFYGYYYSAFAAGDKVYDYKENGVDRNKNLTLGV